jgi:uncharacterized protein (TIGR02588 family)
MTRNNERNERIPLAEWLAAGVGALLILATAGWLVVDLVRASAAPPAITLRIESTTASASSYVVSISAHNTGGETAAGVRIEGELLDAGTNVIERSEATLDYLPRQSIRKLGLFFENDPAQYRLELRATGYRAP